jgi:hypothetical protein
MPPGMTSVSESPDELARARLLASSARHHGRVTPGVPVDKAAGVLANRLDRRSSAQDVGTTTASAAGKAGSQAPVQTPTGEFRHESGVQPM